MSQQLISRSLDLCRLQDEGHHVGIRAGLLVLDQVPYLNSRGELCFGMLVSELTLAGDTTAKPGNHVVYFAGEYPCGCDGQPLRKIAHQSQSKNLRDNLVVDHSFSSKPSSGYEDYYHKMRTYFTLVAGPAIAKYPELCQTRAVVTHVADNEDVFEYLDTASSRAGINRVTNKLRIDNVAIVGLGGTGGYVLDLVAKTPVKQIHLYDGDTFLQHNAFRSPGAASSDQLRERPSKVHYFANAYSRMHKGIRPHPMYVDETNVHELESMDYVFLCLDKSAPRKTISACLHACRVPFIDVGMGVVVEDDSLLGIVRLTTSSDIKSDHLADRLPLRGDDDDGPYTANIQIADLNALNAALAVIKWKKMCGFYLDLDKEHHSTYSIDGNLIINEDRHEENTEADASIHRVRPR